MEESILARHDREWEEYYKDKAKAADRLLSGEWLIRCTYEIKDVGIPPMWLDKIRDDYDTYNQLWGINGVQQTLITHRQWQELDTLARKAEMDSGVKLEDEFKKRAFPPVLDNENIKEQLEQIHRYTEQEKTSRNPIRYMVSAVRGILKKINKPPLQWKKKK